MNEFKVGDTVSYFLAMEGRKASMRHKYLVTGEVVAVTEKRVHVRFSNDKTSTVKRVRHEDLEKIV